MSGNIHRTMRGVSINIDQLILNNEKEIAIGNMNVNARGDELGPNGKITKTHSARVQEVNALHSMVPDDMPIISKADQVVSETTKPKVTRKKRGIKKT